MNCLTRVHKKIRGFDTYMGSKLCESRHSTTNLVRNLCWGRRRHCCSNPYLLLTFQWNTLPISRHTGIQWLHRLMHQSNHQFHAHSRSDEAQPRPSHRALLVQTAVPLTVRCSNYIIAEVATQPGIRTYSISTSSSSSGLGRLLLGWALLLSVAHHQVRVEAQRSVDEQLIIRCAHDCGQPSEQCKVNRDNKERLALSITSTVVRLLTSPPDCQ